MIVKKTTCVDILGVLAVIVGFCLLLYSPDYTRIHIRGLEVIFIRTAGLLLIIAGVFIPSI